MDSTIALGSVLGPLLFILYVNDVTSCSDILRFILFADDTNLFYRNKNLLVLENVMNNELSKLSLWFKANKLSLNAVKTNFMIFGCKRITTELKLTIDGNILERTASTKFLGVYLDEKLNWNCHTYYISSKLSKSLGMLGLCRSILTNDILLTLYVSLIYPYLIYCSIVWGGASATALRKLQVLHNRAVRLITRAHYN